MTPNCDKCNASGLPILPVRYAVVPKDVAVALPGWASGHRIKDIDLGVDYHYALRVMRSGYIYLFYDKNQHGSNQWECYTVMEDGALVKQVSASMAQPPADSVRCGTKGHNSLNTHVLVIERPDKCGTAWIAFSDHKWSDDTLKRYTTDAKLRDARMQTIKVWALATTGKHTHGTAATAQAIESVIEYAPSFNTAQLLDATSTIVKAISKDDGSFSVGDLLKQSTRYPWHLRTGSATRIAEQMKARAKRADGSSNVPTILAIWDSVGITHELNGFRNEAAGRIEQYGKERELQITAINAIDGLKVALAERAGDQVKSRDEQIKQGAGMSQTPAEMKQHRTEASKLPEPQRSRELEICGIREDWAQQQVPVTLGYGMRLGDANTLSEPRRSQAIADLKKEVADFLARRERNGQQNVTNARAQAWPKYHEKLDHKALDDFRRAHDTLLTKADLLIDARTCTLIQWLEAPLFLDTLEDCHPANMSDGLIFEDKVSEAIFGIGASHSGVKLVDAWVKEARASVRSNLLWRAVALNQAEGIVEVDAALKVASGNAQALSGGAWDNVGAQVKWNKLADLYKKAQTLANTNVKAGVNPIAAGPMKAVKDVLLTAGDRIFKPFTRVVDTTNEKALQTLLLIRAGAEPKAALALVAAQINAETLEREAFFRRLANNEHYLNEAAKARQAQLKSAWAALRVEADVPNAKTGAMNAAKDARLALVVAILEGINLWKVSEKAGKSPKDNRVQSQLLAARLATTSAVMDVASNFVKGLASLGDRALTYQALKLCGGALSVVATSYGAKLDADQTRDAVNRNDWCFVVLYGERGAFQAISASLTALTALSYCSPLIATLGERYAERVIGRALSVAAARLLAWRAALIFASLEVSIFILAVSGVIWYFEDDALQKWCKRCAFGDDRFKNGYTTAGKQDEALTAALREVL